MALEVGDDALAVGFAQHDLDVGRSALQRRRPGAGAKYLAVETTPSVTRPAWPAFTAAICGDALGERDLDAAGGLERERRPRRSAPIRRRSSARRSIGTASAASRLRICAWTAGAVSPSRSAAAAIEPVSATATRARSWRRVTASSRGNSENLNGTSEIINSHECEPARKDVSQQVDLSGRNSVRDVASTLPGFVVPQQYRRWSSGSQRVAADLARRIARGLDGSRATASGENADGDAAEGARPDRRRRPSARRSTGSGVRYYASEEQEGALELDPAGVARAGDRSARRVVEHRGQRARSARSSRSTRRRRRRRRASCGRGASLLGAGYVIYGPRCFLVRASARGCRSTSSTRRAGRFRLVGRPGDAAGEVGGVRDQRLELPALGPGRSAPTSTTASPAPRGRASATSTCAGSPRWSPRRIAS